MATTRGQIMPTRLPEPPGRFSLLGLLAGDQYEAGLSRIAADKYGQPQARGLAVPHGRMVRDLGVSSSSAGVALASATSLQAVADAVRPATVLERLGARRVEVSGVSEIAFPRFNGGTGGWLAEGEAAVSDSATIASVSATPHCAAARLGLSRKVRNGAREDVESAVLRELQQCVAATLEAGFLAGSGSSSQPLGVINTPGIGTQLFGGAVPTLAEMAGMLETYADADGDLEAARFILHPSDLADLMKALVSANGGETLISYTGGAWRILGVPVAATRHLPEGKHLLMDPSAVALAYFGPAQVVMDTFSNGKSISGAAEVCVFNFADVAALRPQHIVLGAA
jgi:HK97 family phage major capsid protein